MRRHRLRLRERRARPRSPARTPAPISTRRRDKRFVIDDNDNDLKQFHDASPPLNARRDIRAAS